MKNKLVLMVGCAALVAQGVACTQTDPAANAGDGGTGSSSSGGGSSGGSSGTGTDAGGSSGDGGSDVGECVPYAPATLTGQKAGSFTDGTIVKIDVPETDLGGGLLKVTYTQQGPVTASLFLGIGANPEVPRVETTAFGPGVTDEAPAVVTYRLAGKRSYTLGIQSFSFDPDKAGYTVAYEYQPLADCYESNDTQTAARRIPVNTTITAQHHTGIDGDDTSLVSESGDDWYSFVLAAAKTVKLTAFLPGKDGADGANSTLITVYTADGVTAAACTGQGSMATDPVAATEAVETCEGALASGTYLVAVTHLASQKSSTAVNEPVHSSWNTPYTLRVEAQ